MRLVDAAARMRSLSGAAKALDISQPQMSRRLRQMEDRYGARLFERTPQGLRPTRAGEKLIPLAAGMREAADAVSRALPDLAAAALSTVRITVDEVRARVLTDHIGDLVAGMDGNELEIISIHNHANHENRETEIQIRSCLPESDNLVVRRLGLLNYAAYGASGEHRPYSDNELNRVLKSSKWIGFAPDRLWYPSHAHWLTEQVDARPAVRVNTMTTAMDLVAEGAGLGLLPVFMGDRHPGLTRLTPVQPELQTVENLIVNRDLLREPAIRKTVDAIASVYKKARPALVGDPRLSTAA